MAAAGFEIGAIDGVFTLYNGRGDLGLMARGAAWKLARTLKGKKSGGFKFDPIFHEYLWSKYINVLRNSTIIHNTQLASDVFIAKRRAYGIRSVFYIDGTLREYSDSYGDYDLTDVDQSTLAKAIELEARGYKDADLVAVMSTRSASSLLRDYNIPERKIRIIPPGANIDDHRVTESHMAQVYSGGDFVFGFIGLYPERKGLPKLAQAIQILVDDGLPARLKVIGILPPDLHGIEHIEYVGRLDKRVNPERFLSAISDVHLGCQLSYAELAGIALCEFLRLGIPILGTDVGGATDILRGGGSITMAPDVPLGELAATIATLVNDRGKYEQLRAEAQARRQWANWKRAVVALDLAILESLT